MLRHFNFPDKWLKKTCCADELEKCDLQHNCITHPGSDRSNHRQDLTI